MANATGGSGSRVKKYVLLGVLVLAYPGLFGLIVWGVMRCRNGLEELATEEGRLREVEREEVRLLHRKADLDARKRSMIPGTDYFMQEVRTWLSARPFEEACIPGEHMRAFDGD
ncbi:MAG: hypothetical protein LBG65_06840 [Puniceicoccales bacterium]|jgi:hypothetical protein|nr:hypothetical protein [Puniceicoccales bacterium]